MRANIVVEVSASDRTRLEAIVEDRNSPQKHAWRARIVLLAADGGGTNEIRQQAGVAGAAVWRYDAATETVRPQAVQVARMGEERADVVAGLNSGDRIVALGAHLLKADQKVRQAPPSMTGVAK